MQASELSLNEPFLFLSQLLFVRITVEFTMVAVAAAAAVVVVVFPTTSHVL